ncbi:MAG: hypothetical protein ACTSQO_12715 [Candidatus Helarchaeota archaeon]
MSKEIRIKIKTKKVRYLRARWNFYGIGQVKRISLQKIHHPLYISGYGNETDRIAQSNSLPHFGRLF